MARPYKEGLDYFPIWKPQFNTEIKFHSIDIKFRYQALRNSSSGFIYRKDVREIIFNRDNHKCIICGSKNNLQIDHIVSVWQVAMNKYPIELLNTKSNLKTICKKCNCGKAP